MSHSTATDTAPDPLKPLRRLLRAMHTPGVKVSPTAIFALAEVARREARQEPCPTSALVQALFRGRRQNVRCLILPLERAGYVEWTRSHGRSRSNLRTTPTGRELLRALAGAVESRKP